MRAPIKAEYSFRDFITDEYKKTWTWQNLKDATQSFFNLIEENYSSLKGEELRVDILDKDGSFDIEVLFKYQQSDEEVLRNLKRDLVKAEKDVERQIEYAVRAKAQADAWVIKLRTEIAELEKNNGI